MGEAILIACVGFVAAVGLILGLANHNADFMVIGLLTLTFLVGIFLFKNTK